MQVTRRGHTSRPILVFEKALVHQDFLYFSITVGLWPLVDDDDVVITNRHFVLSPSCNIMFG
jgi:hypothetical protein